MHPWMTFSLALGLAACVPSGSGTDSGTGTDTDIAPTGTSTDPGTGTDVGSGTGTGSGTTGAGTRVTMVVYVDGVCQTLAPKNAAVTVDTTVACNPTPDGSVSDVVCHEDHITYTNHPNNPDCSNQGVAIVLPVGVCQQFPGPFETWKLIDQETYDCLSAP